MLQCKGQITDTVGEHHGIVAPVTAQVLAEIHDCDPSLMLGKRKPDKARGQGSCFSESPYRSRQRETTVRNECISHLCHRLDAAARIIDSPVAIPGYQLRIKRILITMIFLTPVQQTCSDCAVNAAQQT